MTLKEPRTTRERGGDHPIDPYVVAMTAKIGSIMGLAYDNKRSWSASLLRQPPSFFKYPDEKLVDRWIKKINKYTRRLPLCQIWLLDYHVLVDIDRILERMSHETAQPADWGRLRSQFTLIKTNMTNLTGLVRLRHVEELREERKGLFAIVQTLQGLVHKCQEAPSKREHIRDQTLFVVLGEIRNKMLQAETLSIWLIARNALLDGLTLQNQTLHEITKRGYQLQFTAQPEAETHVD
ncbi:hypothetical protein F5Y18DRAFT_176653 [Xylariaceae sp. FL1019]|nr:hypothetical protein F5Y18DRAFT_176653 [Xylariaceae sp. FL1019]